MSRLKTTAGVTAAGLMAIALIGQNEGVRLYAYRDVVGVWTACYGETAGIKPGMKFTKEQCDVMFLDSLTKHEAGMRACLRKPDEIPIAPYVAYLDLAYNIGIGGFCKSSVAKLINAGRFYDACERMRVFTFAGGRFIQGLLNRRERVIAFCLRDA